jgi:hypothetical protein
MDNLVLGIRDGQFRFGKNNSSSLYRPHKTDRYGHILTDISNFNSIIMNYPLINENNCAPRELTRRHGGVRSRQ